MVKKLIFFGRENVGKSTLIKVFFDGESTLELLKNPLEPTIGVNTKIYEFREKIAVFDLPGQTLREIINNPEEIFDSTDVIVIVLDAREKLKLNLRLIREAIQIRERFVSDAYIFVLFHKIDLLEAKEIKKLEKKLLSIPLFTHNIKWFTSSIKDKFRLKLVNTFIDIFRLLGKVNDLIQPYDLNLILLNNWIYEVVKEKGGVTLHELEKKSDVDFSIIQTQMELMEKEGFMNVELNNGEFYYSLSEQGESFYNYFWKFFDSKLEKSFSFSGEETSSVANQSSEPEKFTDLSETELLEYGSKWFYGLMIMDEKGSIIMIHEFQDGLIEKNFNVKSGEEFSFEDIGKFLAAIKMFSNHFKIDLTEGFKLEQDKLRIHLINLNNLLYVCFSSVEFDENLIINNFKGCVKYFDENFKVKTDLAVFKKQINSEMIQGAKKVYLLAKEEVGKPASDIKTYRDLYLRIDTMFNRPTNIPKEKLKELKIQVFDAMIYQDNEKIAKIEKILEKY